MDNAVQASLLMRTVQTRSDYGDALTGSTLEANNLQLGLFAEHPFSRIKGTYKCVLQTRE